ncbi:MAG: hypothetical protein Q7S14_02110 [bacterium]|nr:hypothetical protein [bacterium]
MKKNKKLSNLTSEFFINLSAGWAIAVFVIPTSPGGDLTTKIITLTMNAMFAIVSFGIAYKLRKI